MSSKATGEEVSESEDELSSQQGSSASLVGVEHASSMATGEEMSESEDELSSQHRASLVGVEHASSTAEVSESEDELSEHVGESNGELSSM